jgi:hypothetical protein
MEYHKTDMGLNNNKDVKRATNTNCEVSSLKIDSENSYDYSLKLVKTFQIK